MGSTALTEVVCFDGNVEEVARTSLHHHEKFDVATASEIFNCAVTSNWVDANDREECYTWRAWGSRFQKKHSDKIVGPRDLQSTTVYLNNTMLRIWDHFPVEELRERRW